MTVAVTVRPPGDKSITHRALLLAGMADGTSELRHTLTGTDARSTARVLRRLGVAVSPLRRGGVVQVQGGQWRAPTHTLHCGNSGTTARLLLGLLAGHPFQARLSGDASLQRRPMRRVTAPLGRMGAAIREERGDGLPLWIRGGRLAPLRHETPVASAQVKSALLLAGIVGRVEVTVREPAPSRDHTERLLRYLGYDLQVEGTEVTLRAPARPEGPPRFSLEIPGDLSAAAFLIAAALLADEGELVLEAVGVNPTRTGVLDVLQRMGATIERHEPRALAGEPVADLLVRPTALMGTDVPAHEVPRLIDEIPVLAVLASRATGATRFRSVGELRVKESDRLERIVRNLRAVGGEAVVEGEDLVVAGGAGLPLGQVDTGGDHRLAMAFAVLGTLPGARVALSQPASVAVSYPGFFRDLERIGSRG